MKTRNLLSALLALVSFGMLAQDRTTVTATSNDISENLDLRAVASIFGDSRNLEDFERRLNDPDTQISNLDLNQDYQVDYLRVIETVDGPTHLIVIQSVLGRDLFQDVATIEVERDRYNNVQVQVVGDVYMYGPNYIYEPVYVTRPVFFSSFWIGNYRPYCSSWYWGYYPTYYVAWRPMPVFRYVNHIHVHINHHHHYNYVNVRRSHRAVAMHNRYRTNAYEVRHPDRSFAVRNKGVRNTHELRQNTRREYAATGGVRSANARGKETGSVRSSVGRNQTGGVRPTTGKSESAAATQGNVRGGVTRGQSANTGGIRGTSPSVRGEGGIRQNSTNRFESGGVRGSNPSVRNEGGIKQNSGTVRSQSPVQRESGSRSRSFESSNSRQANAAQQRPQERPQTSVRSSAPRNDRSYSQQRSAPSREASPSRGSSAPRGGGNRGGGDRDGGGRR